MIEDYGDGTTLGHLLIEAMLVFLSFVGIGTIWKENLRLGKDVKNLATNLDAAKSEALLWRNEAETYVKGLSQSIDKQFNSWGLSVAEKEVGFLILKGLTLQDAASVRGTSERTVRQQAQEIYQKSGIAGRAEFSAFFLEDLLVPQK